MNHAPSYHLLHRILLARLLFTTASPTLAQPAAPGPMTFTAFDTNAYGSLTSQELSDARAERMRERAQQGFAMGNAPYAPTFEYFDLDGDGCVTPEEFGTAQVQQHHQQMMQRMMQPPPAPTR